MALAELTPDMAEVPDTPCTICLMPFTEENPATQVHPVNPATPNARPHVFHNNCIARVWFAETDDTHYRCPECRDNCGYNYVEPIMLAAQPNCGICHQALCEDSVATTPDDRSMYPRAFTRHFSQCNCRGHTRCWRDFASGHSTCPICSKDIRSVHSCFQNPAARFWDDDEMTEDEDEEEPLRPAPVWLVAAMNGMLQEALHDPPEWLRRDMLHAALTVVPRPPWLQNAMNTVLQEALRDPPEWLRQDMIRAAFRYYYGDDV